MQGYRMAVYACLYFNSVSYNLFRRIVPTVTLYRPYRSKDNSDLSSVFIPVPVKPNPDDNVGAELTGKLSKPELIKVMNKFFQSKHLKSVGLENGLDSNLLQQACHSFRYFCLEGESLPVDLHVVLSDIIHGASHVDDIFPYFISHARQMFPHLECMDDLKKISDLRSPANWYPGARSLTRKIVFHAGPTNSGKTYHALERFLSAKSGVYCGPLKLLASEVFNKSNSRGTPCDLVTGEERRFADPNGNPSNHTSCTVEMCSLTTPYEVAIVDEIQMMHDIARGWAWTRALLGLMAEEIHVCGEEGAVDLVQSLMATTGDEVEVHTYKRLTELIIENSALGSLDAVQPGDCIVCFSKSDIYTVSRGIEARGKEVAVIYGGLPPGTKLAQAQKFNDPDNSCNIMVATDAIGMGLNLSIRRVVFYSLIKPVVNEKGEKELDVISVSQALQIAGRAGRYRTQYETGYVTTFKPEDLEILKDLLSQKPDLITVAGLHPTAEQIELYAYHLPNASLANLMDIFVTLSTVDASLYFMCNVEDFKFLADMINHVALPLRARYVFCCAPINKKMPFACTMFLKFARQYSRNDALTYNWLCLNIGWPFSLPKTIVELVHLEAVFDVLDLYLWLSYRFMDLFPDASLVRQMQRELDLIIQDGVFQLTRLIKNSDSAGSSVTGSLMGEDYVSYPKLLKKGGRNEMSMGQGRLTKRLLAEGLLTPAMLNELRREWKMGKPPTSVKPESKTSRSRRKPK